MFIIENLLVMFSFCTDSICGNFMLGKFIASQYYLFHFTRLNGSVNEIICLSHSCRFMMSSRFKLSFDSLSLYNV